MLAKLFPKERNFFPVFDQLSVHVSTAISELTKCADSSSGYESAVKKVRQIEAESDRLARESIVQLHESFVTPFDRSHIFQLLIKTGQIVSLTRLVLQKLHSFEIQEIPPEAVKIVAQSTEASRALKSMISQLSKIKTPSETLLLCVSVHKVRSVADEFGFEMLDRLYRDETDLRKLMQAKEINQGLISIIKKFEEVSFLVEEIILEYA